MTLPMKERFEMPEGVIYLDGNSLGPLVRGVDARIAKAVSQEWGGRLIKGWNIDGWADLPRRVGDQIAAIIGASEGSVVMGDTLSIKVFQALASALKMRPERRVILSDNGNFPTDLYMAQGLVKLLGQGYELRVVDPEAVNAAINEEIAAVMLTQVDYRTGRMHDMNEITKRSHEAGAVMIWDLAHSAGAIPLDLAGSAAEFAVGCTYKYLNGGPGAPAFIYVRPDLAGRVEPALAGWFGHEAPFAFDLDYRPAPDIERMRVGTPPVLQLSALETALEIWEQLDMDELRAASIRLSERFISEVESRCRELTLASPRDPAERGSQVSFEFEQGYAAMQALIAEGVIGDFRAPNIMRFGFAPLYLDESDIVRAVDHLERVLRERLWDRPEYLTKQAVT